MKYYVPGKPFGNENAPPKISVLIFDIKICVKIFPMHSVINEFRVQNCSLCQSYFQTSSADKWEIHYDNVYNSSDNFAISNHDSDRNKW